MPKYQRQSASERGYTWAWHKASKAYRYNNPLCAMCLKQGKEVASEVTDHVIPHRLDEARQSKDISKIEIALALFWDESNWQALCKNCHDSVKQTIEKSGYEKGCDVSGYPLDSQHHWNR